MIKRSKPRKWKPPYYIYFIGGPYHGQRKEFKRAFGQYICAPLIDENGTVSAFRYDIELYEDGTIVGLKATTLKRQRADAKKWKRWIEQMDK